MVVCAKQRHSTAHVRWPPPLWWRRCGQAMNGVCWLLLHSHSPPHSKTCPMLSPHMPPHVPYAMNVRLDGHWKTGRLLEAGRMPTFPNANCHFLAPAVEFSTALLAAPLQFEKISLHPTRNSPCWPQSHILRRGTLCCASCAAPPPPSLRCSAQILSSGAARGSSMHLGPDPAAR